MNKRLISSITWPPWTRQKLPLNGKKPRGGVVSSAETRWGWGDRVIITTDVHFITEPLTSFEWWALFLKVEKASAQFQGSWCLMGPGSCFLQPLVHHGTGCHRTEGSSERSVLLIKVKSVNTCKIKVKLEFLLSIKFTKHSSHTSSLFT